jgi:hypothetical protein
LGNGIDIKTVLPKSALNWYEEHSSGYIGENFTLLGIFSVDLEKCDYPNIPIAENQELSYEIKTINGNRTDIKEFTVNAGLQE